MTLVREDQHGLYVKANGWIFRPFSNYDGSPIPSICVKGDKVAARHRGGSIVGVIKKDVVTEHWHTHGLYHGKDSEECWMKG